MPSDPKALGTCPALTELPEPMRRRALDRYQALRPHLEDNLPLTRVAKEASVPFRTAQRWVSRYRRFGLAGLARAGRADRGKPRRLSAELCGLAEGLALQRLPPGPGAIYREVCRVADAQGYRRPSYHTVYKAIRAIPDNLKTLALDGEKAYRETYDLLHRREADGPNEIWQADHTQLDLAALRLKVGKTALYEALR
jgi:putative transposase